MIPRSTDAAETEPYRQSVTRAQEASQIAVNVGMRPSARPARPNSRDVNVMPGRAAVCASSSNIVKVAHAIQQDRVRLLGLQLQILLACWVMTMTALRSPVTRISIAARWR